MRKGLFGILILLGIAEITVAVTDFRLPLPIALVMGFLFIALGVQSFLYVRRKK